MKTSPEGVLYVDRCFRLGHLTSFIENPLLKVLALIVITSSFLLFWQRLSLAHCRPSRVEEFLLLQPFS